MATTKSENDNQVQQNRSSGSFRREEGKCGWFCYKPELLQRFRTSKWALLFLSCGAFIQGVTINGFLHCVITTIERRFHLHSNETGLISAGYDIASLIFLIPLTYLGGRPTSCKPHWIGYGLIVFGIGSLVTSLPHLFVKPEYKVEQDYLLLCNITAGNSHNIENCEQGEEDSLSQYKWIFLLGNLLHGAGAAPLFTLGVTYLDESVHQTDCALYMGIYYTVATIGPSVGYIMCAWLLQIHEDFLSVDVYKFGLVSSNKGWIGAWWLGFVVCGCLAIIASFPILALPAKLPGWEEINVSRESETIVGQNRTKAFEKISELPQALFELFRNLSFVFLNLAGCCESILLSGSGTFLPKIIEVQFHLSSKMVAFVMGVVAIPSAVFGTMLGGAAVKVYSLKFLGVLRMCVFTTIVSAVFASCFLIKCPDDNVAGVTTPYFEEKDFQLTNECNEHCGCTPTKYLPVCGINNITYFSPCHAGCSLSTHSSRRKLTIFYNCSCIEQDKRNQLSFGKKHKLFTSSIDAFNEPCMQACPYFKYFVILLFCTLLFTFLAVIPSLTATLRCVKSDQRSLAMGLQWMMVRLLGMIPGPVLFGALIDNTCLVWQKSCFREGACAFYDYFLISRFILLLTYGWKILSLTFFFLSMWYYKYIVRR